MNRFDRPRRSLAIAMASLAGFVDAIGFLTGDSYFVSFMSGNTTRLAVDFVRRPAAALAPLLLIAGFVAGVAVGYALAVRAGRWRKPAVLGAVTALLLIASLCGAASLDAPMLATLVLGMGALNNTLQRDETPIGLTYMTGALVRLGQGIGAALAGRPRPGWGAHVLLWCGLSTGALAGAAAFARLGAAALWLATAFAFAATLMGWRLSANAAD